MRTISGIRLPYVSFPLWMTGTAPRHAHTKYSKIQPGNFPYTAYPKNRRSSTQINSQSLERSGTIAEVGGASDAGRSKLAFHSISVPCRSIQALRRQLLTEFSTTTVTSVAFSIWQLVRARTCRSTGSGGNYGVLWIRWAETETPDQES